MAERGGDQRLAAILAADVAGYTKLMANDEAATIETIKNYRSRFLIHVEANGGRVVDMAGDSVLAVFASTSGAVTAANRTQRELSPLNSELPEARRMHFRIGINLGDIREDADGTVYGEGVNLAARLEALAEPGGIVVSRSVFDEVKSKLDMDFEDLGTHQVKNIDEPVSAYALRGVGRTAARGSAKKGKALALAAVIACLMALGSWLLWPDAETDTETLALPDKPSLAVLPFANLSDDIEQGHFADGITEDLITDLSKIEGLFVIARNSVFTYKGKPTKVQEVAADLGVRYVLEGSVRRTDDSIRINAQLIDAREGHHLWAERYDGEASGLFDFQDVVMAQIVANLSIELTGADDAATPDVAGTEIIAAYDAYLSGREHFRQSNTEAYRKAIAAYEEAIELDPDYGQAYAALAEVWLSLHKLAWRFAIGDGYRENFDQLRRNVARAKALPTAHAFVVSAELLARHGNLTEALADAERAIALAPNDPDAHISRAGVLNFLGRAEEAEASARTALRLDPHHRPAHLRILGQSLFHQERYPEAVEIMQRVVSRQGNIAFDYATLAAAYGHLGEGQQANTAAERGSELLGGLLGRPLSVQENGMFWWHGDIFDYDPDYRARLAEGLRKAGVAEGPGAPDRYAEYRARMTKLGAEYVVDGAVKVDAAAAKALHDEGATFVDVRGGMNYREGHIPGALDLDLNFVLSEETLSQYVGKDQDVVFYCFAIYCPYSAYAAAKALVWGYTEVFRFDGGYPGWVDAGYPVESLVGPGS